MIRTKPNSRTIAFFPWLTLDRVVEMVDFVFIPFKDTHGNINPYLKDVANSLETILSCYVDLYGKRVSNCTVICKMDMKPAWDYSGGTEEEIRKTFDKIQEKVLFLFLAGLSNNDYFLDTSTKVNSVTFQFYMQNFSEPLEWTAFQIRRRDGFTLSAGYKYGEIRFTAPLQCQGLLNKPVTPDIALAKSLTEAFGKGPSLINRLGPSLSFLSQANTNSTELTSAKTETIMLSSAFGQLLDQDSAYTISKAFGKLWQKYGRVTAESTLKSRPGIQFQAKYEQAQKAWFVHRKWIEELYDLRSVYVHGEPYEKRKWGWFPAEHLIAGTFAFPLMVKLLLEKEQLYTLTEQDLKWCHAFDPLLACDEWYKDEEESGRSRWQTIISKTSIDSAFEKLKTALSEPEKE